MLCIPLHYAAQGNLHPAGQDNTLILLQDEGDTAFAGLAVDAHHRLVIPPQIGRVDGQIGHIPEISWLAFAQAFAYGILMAAGKRGVHQIPRIGVAGVQGNLGDILYHGNDFIHGGQIQLRVHTAAVQVHGHGYNVHVAGALAVAQQSAFHPIGTGHHAQFSRGHATAAVIVGVQ